MVQSIFTTFLSPFVYQRREPPRKCTRQWKQSSSKHRPRRLGDESDQKEERHLVKNDWACWCQCWKSFFFFYFLLPLEIFWGNHLSLSLFLAIYLFLCPFILSEFIILLSFHPSPDSLYLKNSTSFQLNFKNNKKTTIKNPKRVRAVGGWFLCEEDYIMSMTARGCQTNIFFFFIHKF